MRRSELLVGPAPDDWAVDLDLRGRQWRKRADARLAAAGLPASSETGRSRWRWHFRNNRLFEASMSVLENQSFLLRPEVGTWTRRHWTFPHDAPELTALGLRPYLLEFLQLEELAPVTVTVPSGANAGSEIIWRWLRPVSVEDFRCLSVARGREHVWNLPTDAFLSGISLYQERLYLHCRGSAADLDRAARILDNIPDVCYPRMSSSSTAPRR